MDGTQRRRAGPIIDAHAHVYMDDIAQRALRQIASFYGFTGRMHEDACVGTVDDLLERDTRCGISASLVSEAAHRPELVERLNRFIAQSCRHAEEKGGPRFYGLCTVHPDCEDIPGILGQAKAEGLRGVKIHPDYQEFDMDDRRCDPIYDFCREEGFPVLIHCGDVRFDFSSPRRLQHVIDRFPGLPLIAAHMGGYRRWDEAFELRAGETTFFDVSSSLFALPRERAAAFFKKFGPERFFFGTDYPLFEPEAEIRRFLSLELPPEWEEAILYRNFVRAFSLGDG